MHLLTTLEALEATDAFLWTVYGDELFNTWKTMKVKMNFTSEREYVAWLMQVALEHEQMQNIKSGSEYLRNSSTSSNNKTPLTARVFQAQPQKAYSKDVKQEQSASACNDSAGMLDLEVAEEYYSDDNNVREYESTEPSTSLAAQHIIEEEPEAGDDSYVKGEYDEGDRQQRVDEITLDSDNDDSEMAVAEPEMGSYADDALLGQPYYDNDCGTRAEGRLSYGDHDAIAGPSTTAANNETKAKVSHQPLALNPIAYQSAAASKKMACVYCSYRSSKKQNLEHHLIYKHGFPSRFTCNICGKGFHSPKILSAHSYTCHSKLSHT